MVPLFPTMVTSDDGALSNPRPISIQKLIPNQTPIQHHFKHLPAAQLQTVAERARADHQLEQTTRLLIQALNLQERAGPAGRPRPRGAASQADLDKAQSDSEVSSILSKQRNETSDSIHHIPTATTLLSEQGTQTGPSRGGRAQAGHLPSLHLLRTLQARLVDTLQQVNELRSQGPWQERVVDQLDWNRKLVRMEEFHAKITREMYILTRQVDLIMDNVCSIPESRVTSTMKGDVIRKLVRAHRSALRVTQAFVQNYWDGSLDGRQAARFLEVLSVCRNLVDICSHLGIRFSDISDMPERLAALVGQHVTTAGDVGSLIREMALGRFGPAAERRRRQLRLPARPGSTGSRPHKHHQKVKSTIERLIASKTGEKSSVRSAPAVRRVQRPSKSLRPGSAPHAAPKQAQPGAVASAESARPPLAPLPEEDVESGGPPDRLESLTAAVERAVGRALARLATDPALTPGRPAAAPETPDRPAPPPQDGPRAAGQEGRPPVDGQTRRQLARVLARLDEMQQEREVIRRRWQPLIQARRMKSEEDASLDLETDDLDLLTEPVSIGAPAGPGPVQPASQQPASQQPHRSAGLPGVDASTSTTSLAGPALQTSVRQLFANEAIDPELRGTIAAELRNFMGNSTDETIRSLPEATIHQLVDEFISEAGVDIFLHQLFDQEFELR